MLAGSAFLCLVKASIHLSLEAGAVLLIPLGRRRNGWQRLDYGQGVAGNWDSKAMQAAVAVAARSGVGVAVGVAVTTLMTGVVIAGAQVGQIGGATGVAGHISSIEISGHPSPGRFRSPNHQRAIPMIRLTSSPSRKPSNRSRVMNLLRGADFFLIFGSVSEPEESSMERLPSAPTQNPLELLGDGAPVWRNLRHCGSGNQRWILACNAKRTSTLLAASLPTHRSDRMEGYYYGMGVEVGVGVGVGVGSGRPPFA